MRKIVALVSSASWPRGGRHVLTAREGNMPVLPGVLLGDFRVRHSVSGVVEGYFVAVMPLGRRVMSCCVCSVWH